MTERPALYLIDGSRDQRPLEIVSGIAVRRERLQFNNQDAAQVVPGIVVELARDIDDLAQLRHVRQARLKLVENDLPVGFRSPAEAVDA